MNLITSQFVKVERTEVRRVREPGGTGDESRVDKGAGMGG